MSKLPILSGKEVIKILEKIGYQKSHQAGSHIRLHCFGRKSVTVPDYKSISRGLLRKIIRDARLNPEEFLKFIKSK